MNPRQQPKHDDLVHEALDRARITSSHLQMALEDHDVIQQYPDVRAAYEKAVAAIENLYQLIGQKFEE